MAPRFKSKNEIVYDQLRQDILQGVYEAGSRLIIDELATTLGVSQIPIREAMRQLESDGFVTIVPHVGAKVTDIDADFIFEVFALLESIEVVCSKAACQTITDDEIETLKHMVSEMDSSVSNPALWADQNKAMHLYICQIAGTRLALKMMEKVLDHWDRLRFRYLNDVFGLRTPQAQKEHREILNAFARRDSEAVEHAVRMHNHNALESYLQHMQKKGHLEITEK